MWLLFERADIEIRGLALKLLRQLGDSTDDLQAQYQGAVERKKYEEMEAEIQRILG
jgi:hypothetical protein